jgi:mannose/fructose/N-acetylgalactosamine-specific phosphotransferase system component IIC
VGEGLIWTAASFVGGGLLLLERRCLGQMAFVQPLVLCAIAGLVTGQEQAGIWIGVSLQLLAQGHARNANWSLAGVAAALTILLAPRLGLTLQPGAPGALMAVAIPALASVATRRIELRLARRDGDRLRRKPPWDEPDPKRALERLVHGRIARGWLLGGIETAIIGATAVLAMLAASKSGTSNEVWRAMVRALVPALGAAVAACAVVQHRLLALTGLGLVGTLLVMVIR